MSEPLRVLLVEDEALILMQMEDLIEGAGHRVVGTAMRGEEAIAIARRVRPDLALVDLCLCDGDSGLNVARALQENGALVVFVTANPARLGADLSGAAGVIAKPFTRAVVADGITYLEACVRHPPPVAPLPRGMQMARAFLPQ